MNLIIKHWINKDNTYIELVDDFEYYNSQVIVPDDNFVWVDIYGLNHNMEQRDGMPPLIACNNNIINYYW